MKDRPIPFTAPMVQALLEGRKTQTRRIVKGIPDNATLHRYYGAYTDGRLGGAPRAELAHSLGWFVPEAGDLWPCNDKDRIRCPYGQPGDRLWVREAWQAWKEFDHLPPRDIPSHALERINYLADGNKWDARYRHARFMPRWASRILLEITDVRVERLQDISIEDAHAEGVGIQCDSPMAIMEYSLLWESINGAGSWDTNPFVWVIEFNVLVAALEAK